MSHKCPECGRYIRRHGTTYSEWNIKCHLCDDKAFKELSEMVKKTLELYKKELGIKGHP